VRQWQVLLVEHFRHFGFRVVAGDLHAIDPSPEIRYESGAPMD